MPTFETVTLDSEFSVYASVSTADIYADAADHGGAFRDLDDTEKGRKLVTATRILDRQRWLGDKLNEGQEHAFPRKSTGITEMEAVDFPARVQQAAIEIALALANGSALQDNATTNQRISSLSAGSVSLSFLSNPDGPISKRFPQIVHELISDFLGGSSMAVSGVATGTDGKSKTGTDFGFSSPI